MNEFLTIEELCGFTEPEYEDELWGVIPGYSNYYVSTKGRVWNDKYKRFLKPGIDSNGYPMVVLSSNGKCRTIKIHRLEALVFMPNPDNLNVVRHLDDNKLNNDINNLERGTYSQNANDAIRNGCWDNTLRPVTMVNNDTGIGYYYESCAEASRDLGYNPKSVSVALERGTNIGGYRIEDSKEEYLYESIKNGDPVKHLFPTQKIKRPKQSTKVRCTRCEDGEEMIFDNIIEVVKFFDSPYATIRNAIYGKHKHKGYHIEYV